MENENKVVAAYIVKHYADGDTAVEDAGIEGTESLDTEQIYRDIEETSRLINIKRLENAAYMGAYRFFTDLQAKKEQVEAAQATDLTDLSTKQ